MFRKLKLAGAHPDILWGIDAQKAQHNGEEMIRLETLMHQRETRSIQSNTPEHFLFWLKAASEQNSASAASLRSVQCTITPLSSSRIVKQQLTSLFSDANILEDFELQNSEGVEMNLESVLRYADERQTEHLQQSGTLYIRGEKSIERLRAFGVMLVVEEEGQSYLVTLPEMIDSYGRSSASASERFVSGDGYKNQSGNPSYDKPRSILGPNGEMDEGVQEFMAERGLKSFDLRMAGSASSVERFVSAFEKIERVYDIHRGRALRSGVCIVLSLKKHASHNQGYSNLVAPDGCIVLSVYQMPTWEEFLLSLPQQVWMDCVQKQKDWRGSTAPLLNERKRKLMRIADMFHFYHVSLENTLASPVDWQEELIRRFYKEENVIRNAIKKYNLKSDLLKKRGQIVIQHHLYSHSETYNTDHTRKEIGFRIGGDGIVYFNFSTMNTGQMLRVLKDNIKRIESMQKRHDNVVATLEHLSRNVPIDFSIDVNWKRREEGNLVNCMEKFQKTIKQNEMLLAAFLKDLLHNSPLYKNQGGNGVPKKRMVWIISDKFDTLPSGILFIPWDVDFESIKRLLLNR